MDFDDDDDWNQPKDKAFNRGKPIPKLYTAAFNTLVGVLQREEPHPVLLSNLSFSLKQHNLKHLGFSKLIQFVTAAESYGLVEIFKGTGRESKVDYVRLPKAVASGEDAMEPGRDRVPPGIPGMNPDKRYQRRKNQIESSISGNSNKGDFEHRSLQQQFYKPPPPPDEFIQYQAQNNAIGRYNNNNNYNNNNRNNNITQNMSEQLQYQSRPAPEREQGQPVVFTPPPVHPIADPPQELKALMQKKAQKELIPALFAAPAIDVPAEWGDEFSEQNECVKTVKNSALNAITIANAIAPPHNQFLETCYFSEQPVLAASAQTHSPELSFSTASISRATKERNLRKILKQIESIKNRQMAGEVLDGEQIAKVKREEGILNELKDLENLKV